MVFWCDVQNRYSLWFGSGYQQHLDTLQATWASCLVDGSLAYKVLKTHKGDKWETALHGFCVCDASAVRVTEDWPACWRRLRPESATPGTEGVLRTPQCVSASGWSGWSQSSPRNPSAPGAPRTPAVNSTQHDSVSSEIIERFGWVLTVIHVNMTLILYFHSDQLNSFYIQSVHFCFMWTVSYSSQKYYCTSLYTNMIIAF